VADTASIERIFASIKSTKQYTQGNLSRDREAENVMVNGYAIGAGHDLPAFQQISSERNRRHCKLRQQSSDTN
jgi:hypothetical protein